MFHLKQILFYGFENLFELDKFLPYTESILQRAYCIFYLFLPGSQIFSVEGMFSLSSSFVLTGFTATFFQFEMIQNITIK